jgi:hypothetical protein
VGFGSTGRFGVGPDRSTAHSMSSMATLATTSRNSALHCGVICYMAISIHFHVALFLVAVYALSGATRQLFGAEDVMAATLCAIVKDPSHFNGRRVRFSAALESDGIHNSVLISSGCKAGIAPYPAEKNQNTSELGALDSALEKGMAGTLDKSIKAVFVGVFEFRPQARVQRILHIQRVLSLTVTPKEGAQPSPQ